MCVCVRVCVVIPFILDVRSVDVPAGVTQEEGHAGFFHLPSAVLALIFLARRIQPFLSLVGREVKKCCVLTIESFSTCSASFYFSFSFCEEKSQFVGRHRDSNSRPNVRSLRGYQLNHHRGDRRWEDPYYSKNRQDDRSCNRWVWQPSTLRPIGRK